MNQRLFKKIRCHVINLFEDDFIVLGSDGIFDALSIVELAKIIQDACETLSTKVKLKEIKSEPDIKRPDNSYQLLQEMARSDKFDIKSDLNRPSTEKGSVGPTQ